MPTRDPVAPVAPRRVDRSAATLRHWLGVNWRRLQRAWRQWPEALALRLTLVLYRARRGRPFDDDAPGVTTPIRYLWNDFLMRNRDAFVGRGLEIGDARMTAAVGGARMDRCEVVDLVTGPGVDYAIDLQHAWALPEGQFDVFLNQFTVHAVADDRAVLWHSLRILRAGGTLLVTFPCAGLAPHDGVQYGATHSVIWRWYTLPGVRALLEDLGLDGAHAVLEPLGGAAAIASYLLGVPVEAMSRSAVRDTDPDAPLLIAARITKPVQWAPPWSPSR